MDRRIAAGAGIVLAMEVVNTYQLVLPPLYGKEEMDSQEIRQGAKFVAIYILAVAFAAGILTQSAYPIVLPGITLGVLYLVYMSQTSKRIVPTNVEA